MPFKNMQIDLTYIVNVMIIMHIFYHFLISLLINKFPLGRSIERYKN